MSEPPTELPAHYFRHEFGRLVSALVRRFGVSQVALCEDAAQAALLAAVQGWMRNGLPDNPAAWLYQVAQNSLLDVLRKQRRVVSMPSDGMDVASGQNGATNAVSAHGPVNSDAVEAPANVFLAGEVADDVLRLLFVCVDPRVPRESQLVFALRTLCGFSTEEIALRLFHSVEATHKKLQRARQVLREGPFSMDMPSATEMPKRLPAVLHILYLLFNEGYSSAQPDQVIRRELCEEAVRLALLLRDHALCNTPETNALLALMYLHASRFEARSDGAGGLLMLEEQDRSLWDQELISIGLGFLESAAVGQTFSRYHAEAAIAAEHCLAKSFAATRWDAIAGLYSALERHEPSPLFTLNRAIALAEWRGVEAGLALLEATKPPGWLLGYYLWDATLGELYRRRGDLERAHEHLLRAQSMAPTQAEKDLLGRRLLLAGALS